MNKQHHVRDAGKNEFGKKDEKVSLTFLHDLREKMLAARLLKPSMFSDYESMLKCQLL